MEKGEKGKGISHIQVKNIDKILYLDINNVINSYLKYNMWEFSQIIQNRKELIRWLPSLADLSESGMQPDYGNSFFSFWLLPREAYSDENDFHADLMDQAEWLKSMPKYHEWGVFSQSDVIGILNTKDSELKKSLFDEIDVVDIIQALDNNVNKFRRLGIVIEEKWENLDMNAWYSGACQERPELYDLRVRQDLILRINRETREEIKWDIHRIMNTDVSTLINKS